MRETPYWTWHIMTGLIILVFLTLHMIVMHLDGIFAISNPAGGAATSWENVIYRSQNVFYSLTYIILLGAALYHGLYGLRTILFELNLKKGFQRFINIFFWVVGICLFAVGTSASIAVQRMTSAG